MISATIAASRSGSVVTRDKTVRATMMTISVLGDTFADIVCNPLEHLPTWGTDTLVSEPIRVMLGGSAANFAVHAANLNRDQAIAADFSSPSSVSRQTCLLHTSVAADDMGRLLRQKLDDFGVEWSQTKEREHQGACVVLSGRTDRSFITHRGSVAQFCREDIDVPRLLASSHIHVAGFYNCPELAKDLTELLAEGRSRGATCSLGPQWDASEDWGGLEPLYASMDVFMPNEVEALNISRCKDVFEAASFFVDKGVGLVVVTRGGSGAIAMSAGSAGDSPENVTGSSEDTTRAGARGVRKTWEQNCSAVEVVDTTGAGDAFSAGFLHVWKATGDVQAALRWGCALGTAVVTRVGASARLSVEDDIRPHLP